MLSEIVSKSTVGVSNMNQHPVLSLFTKFELNLLRNKIREPKIEMTS